jgi:hypothetical protein
MYFISEMKFFRSPQFRFINFAPKYLNSNESNRHHNKLG